MFSSKHQIWKFAYAGDELEDWLQYAEDLIHKWSSQTDNEVEFQTTFEIIIASLLLQDDLLPLAAKKALATTLLATMNETIENKLHVDSLHIHPPTPGRKKNRLDTFLRFHEVKSHIQSGKSASEAYGLVAAAHFKSAETIRREYERNIKHIQERKTSGKTINDFPDDQT